MTPNASSQRPPRKASAGMIVCIGRLSGPNVLGWSGSTTKQAPRLVSMMPVACERHPPCAVDAPGEFGRETLVEQRRHRGAHESGVGDVGIAHGVGEPRRLERQMEAV